MVAQTVEPLARLNPDQDIPAGLDQLDVLAYRRGYSRACLTYVRKHGAPSAQHDGGAPAAGTAERRALGVQLAADTRAHELERHPAAHRAGMSALNKSRKLRNLEPIADPCKPARKKAPARKLAAVPDPAPVKRTRKTRAPKTVPGEHGITPAEVAEVHTDADNPGRVEKVETTAHRTRKAARRALAAEMRARGENPADVNAWAAAKLAAGVK